MKKRTDKEDTIYHRDYEGKKEVIIYDYVDSNIRVLDNMYHKRLRAYKKNWVFPLLTVSNIFLSN